MNTCRVYIFFFTWVSVGLKGSWNILVELYNVEPDCAEFRRVESNCVEYRSAESDYEKFSSVKSDCTELVCSRVYLNCVQPCRTVYILFWLNGRIIVRLKKS